MRHHLKGQRGLALRGLALVALAAGTGGCNTDDIVSVNDPNNLTPETVASAGSTPALAQGAIFQFRGGYSGFGDDAFVTSSALISDEFYYGDTFTTRQAADIRSLQPPALGNVSDPSFNRFQTARIQARRAFAQILKFTTASTATADSTLAARMRAIEGYVYVSLSEGWCGSVPFTVVPDSGTIDPTKIQGGDPIGTRAMNDTAIARFDEALRYRSTDNLAKIGRGRALLNEGRFQEAAAAVATVPTNFVYLLEHSDNSQPEYNAVNALQSNGRYGIANLEGGTRTSSAGAVTALRPDTVAPALTNASAAGLPFRAIADPRIPFENRGSGACFSSSVRCYNNDNYPTFRAAVPLASGVEARLILAEALYQSGQYGAMLDSLNSLRKSIFPLVAALYPAQKQVFATDTVAQKPLPASAIASPTAARQTLFAERAYWLFNTGHRQGDLRRLARAPYSLATNQVFPSGPFFRGGTYGNDVAFPLPFNEANNPRFIANACSTTTP